MHAVTTHCECRFRNHAYAPVALLNAPSANREDGHLIRILHNRKETNFLANYNSDFRTSVVARKRESGRSLEFATRQYDVALIATQDEFRQLGRISCARRHASSVDRMRGPMAAQQIRSLSI